MNNVDKKYIEIAKKILEEGYDEEKLNKEVRPVWEDGESAYTKFLPQQVVSYEKGEVPLISLRKIGARYYLSRVEINQALCQSSVQLLYIKTQDGQQPTSDKKRVGRILGNRRRTRKT